MLADACASEQRECEEEKQFGILAANLAAAYKFIEDMESSMVNQEYMRL